MINDQLSIMNYQLSIMNLPRPRQPHEQDCLPARELPIFSP